MTRRTPTAPRAGRTTRTGLALAAFALAAGLAACTGDGDPSTVESPPAGTPSSGSASPSATAAARLVEVTVRGNRVTEGPDRVSVRRGELVIVRVDSDTADEVHVHGYDMKTSVGPGTSSELRFTADRTGIYEVELEREHLLLFALAVR